MTESEWLECEDPQRMLLHLEEAAIALDFHYPSDRKLRLWCLACRHASGRGHGDNLYRIIDRTDGADGGNAANNARSWANPDFDEPEDPSPAMKCDILRDIIGNPFRPVTVDPQWLTSTVITLATAAHEEREMVECTECDGRGGRWDTEAIDQWYRCQPCHGAGRLDTGRLDPVRLAVLADALVDAGMPEEVEGPCSLCRGAGVIEDTIGTDWPCVKCSEGGRWAGSGKQKVPNPILEHLRDPGPHYRGCHVIDLLTGRE